MTNITNAKRYNDMFHDFGKEIEIYGEELEVYQRTLDGTRVLIGTEPVETKTQFRAALKKYFSPSGVKKQYKDWFDRKTPQFR